MKTLALLRHGKSSWDDTSLADFDRGLKGRGRDASRKVGQDMRLRGLRFDRVIASPARRVKETIELAEEGFGSPFDVRLDPQIYEASGRSLEDLLRKTDDRFDSLLLVGHNPGLQDLATALVAADDPRRDEVAADFPTAALVVIRLRCSNWRELRDHEGQIASFTRPRDLT